MLTIFICLLFYHSKFSSSAPVAGLVKNEHITTGWQGDPDGRGTMTLLLSCLATLSLCVYSSIHLNLPRHNQTKIRYWLKSGKWLLTGIFAPELVVFAAWRQYSSARVLQKLIEGNMKSIAIKEEERRKRELESDGDSEGDNKPRPLPRLEYTWTLMHGFYAGMGGFVIDLVPYQREPSFIPRKYERLTLTARGVKLLYECGHLPVMQKSDIKDKSKADSLAKSLVCLQAGWMCIQVLGRILGGLPVTLLEVNTLGHVFCALVVYLLWWHKPQLINEPTKLEGDWVKPLCAFMYMSSRISGGIARNPGMLKHAWKEPELAKLQYVDQTTEHESSNGELAEVRTESTLPVIAEDLINNQQNQEPIVQSLPKTSRSIETLNSGIASNTHRVAINRSLSDATTVVPYPAYHGFVPVAEAPAKSSNSDKGFPCTLPNDEDLERWRLVNEAYRLFPPVRDRFVESGEFAEDGSPLLKFKGNKPEELIHECAGNWPSDDLLRETQGLVMGSILWCASMVFGAVHIAAWHDYFPSSAERWMWRASAIWITFSGGLWMLINLIAHFSKVIDDYWERVITFKASWFSNIVLGIVCTCCGIAYIAARIFLVVEAFISIRQLPVTAYSTPEWSQIIPHL